MGKLFGTDGIRGVAGQYPLDPETLTQIGRAVARYFHARADGDPPLIVIGRDTRISGPGIETAISTGIRSVGVDVLPLGVLPTPGVAYLTRHLGACGGMVVSASHNPFQDNGIKLFRKTGHKLPVTAEADIESLIFGGDPASEKSGTGKAGEGAIRTPGVDPRNAYLQFLHRCCRNASDFRGLKIVLDCSNGATSQIAPRLFQELGTDVIAISAAPDGRNINAQCGSEHPEHLADRVIKTGASIGLAFDGDGDRLVAVDEGGAVLTGDQILAVCAAYLKNRGRLQNNLVVSTVMSNIGFGRALREMGIRHIQTDVGDRHVMEAMREHGGVLGGENSGHMIFFEDQTTGDGIVSALHLLEVMRGTGKPLSELAAVMTVFPQHILNVAVSSKPDFAEIPEIRETVDRVKQELGEAGRVLIRYSGTQPICRVMVEGPTMAVTRAACERIAETAGRVLG